MSYIIAEDKIKDWLKELNQKSKVIVPARIGQQIKFRSLKEKTRIVFGYKTTYVSVKEYFLPAQEKTFTYYVKTEKARNLVTLPDLGPNDETMPAIEKVAANQNSSRK